MGKVWRVFYPFWSKRVFRLCRCIWRRWRVRDGKRLAVFDPLLPVLHLGLAELSFLASHGFGVSIVWVTKHVTSGHQEGRRAACGVRVRSINHDTKRGGGLKLQRHGEITAYPR